MLINQKRKQQDKLYLGCLKLLIKLFQNVNNLVKFNLLRNGMTSIRIGNFQFL